MGAWGTAIFSDDTACDVRAAYRALIADGSTGPEATDRLLYDWKQEIADEDDGPTFWLALAATQWQCGRLEARVKSKALAIIDNESSLGRWTEGGSTKDLKQRRAVLDKLRAQLRSPQPAEKKIRKPYADICAWARGEVVAYRLRSRKWILLHVVDHAGDSQSGNPPIFAVLDWVGDKPPDAEAIKVLPLKKEAGLTVPYLLMVMRRRDKDLPSDRINCLGIKRKPHSKVIGGFGFCLWGDLDRNLREDLGLK